jgi:hypothetical protein
LWKDENDEDDFFTEDQLMEDFTFKVAKRRLGIQIDMEDGEDLFQNTEFKVFQILDSKCKIKSNKEVTKKVDWKWMGYIALIMIVFKILFKIIFQKN